MNIAVAGSKGFVGKAVCALFKKEGHEIFPIDIACGLDLCSPTIVNIVPKIDCLIHLANLIYVPSSYENPAEFYRVNYLTTLNALEICRKRDAKLIYISSYIYGHPQYLPVDELHPICPLNPYAQSKVICEKLCEGYFRDFKMQISIIRPFNIYGVGQKGKLLIPEIITQLKEGKKIIKLKAAAPRRDYVNVIDLARAIKLCAETGCAVGTYNVCSGHSVSVLEITEIINRYLKQKVEFLFTSSDRPNEMDETIGSFEKIKAIGWNPSISFEEGIKAIIESESILL